MYRYRDNSGATRLGLKRMKHLPKVGKVLEIVGKRWRGRYGLNEGVFVKGTTGTARFNSFLWSYSGEGPRGLVELLVTLGLNRQAAESFARNTPRHDQPGIDWKISFPGHGIECQMTFWSERPVNWQVGRVGAQRQSASKVSAPSQYIIAHF